MIITYFNVVDDGTTAQEVQFQYINNIKKQQENWLLFKLIKINVLQTEI